LDVDGLTFDRYQQTAHILMKIIYAIAAHLLVLALPICTAKALPSPSPDPEGLYANKVGKSPEEVMRHYEQQAPTASADFFTLALAYYAKADFPRALDLANRALALQSVPLAQAVCFFVIAECHGALGQYDLAAEAALQGVRTKCGNNKLEKELAALRFAYATEAGNELQARAAKDHLKHLDANFDSKPTVDPVTLILIVYAATYTVYCLTKAVIAKFASKDPEAARKVGDSLQPPLEAGKLAGLLALFTPTSQVIAQ
jgi:tetratricopeptide (TPR) repeat protein